jgi:NADH:ubiquinone reductase (H+-translocating)
VPHIVVIGGGFAGLTLCQRLVRRPVWVTLVDRSNHHLFQPLLYQVAMAGLSPADIAIPIRAVLRRQSNARVVMAEVVGVDFKAQHLVLHDGEQLAYDYLVVAAGASTNFFGHESSWGAHALGMKSLEDAIEMRRRVLLAFEAAEREPSPEARRKLLTFVVIGGGPTGVEVAGALAELARFVLADDFRAIHPSDARVVLIEAGARLLAGGFSEKLSRLAQAQLIELGVEVRLGAQVRDISEGCVHFETDDLEAATILWTAGVRGRRLARLLGAELDRTGRIVVHQDCSLPGHPEVFAIGDIASFTPEGKSQPLPGLAPVAMQQGRYVARAILDRARGKSPKPFHYVDKGIMATIGRSRAVAQSGRLELSGLVAWMMWLVVHIWYLITFRNRLLVLFGWFYNYALYRRGARLITGERSWRSLGMLANEAAGRVGVHGEPLPPDCEQSGSVPRT